MEVPCAGEHLGPAVDKPSMTSWLDNNENRKSLHTK